MLLCAPSVEPRVSGLGWLASFWCPFKSSKRKGPEAQGNKGRSHRLAMAEEGHLAIDKANQKPPALKDANNSSLREGEFQRHALKPSPLKGWVGQTDPLQANNCYSKLQNALQEGFCIARSSVKR